LGEKLGERRDPDGVLDGGQEFFAVAGALEAIKDRLGGLRRAVDS
jgi:hypothetical protein